jgi:hypothetical protein
MIWYSQMYNGKKSWVTICEELEEDALKYIYKKGYNPELKITQ